MALNFMNIVNKMNIPGILTIPMHSLYVSTINIVSDLDVVVNDSSSFCSSCYCAFLFDVFYVILCKSQGF